MTTQTSADLEAAVRKYARTLAKTAYAYTGSVHDAEDIAQECFIALMQSGKTFENDEHLKAWLLRVAINKSKNLIKSPSRTRAAELTEDVAASDAPKNELLGAVTALSPKYRIPVHLFYYEGYSIKEIADLTGERPATIGSRLDRARDRLKDLLGGDDI